jgi:hypothetical protein
MQNIKAEQLRPRHVESVPVSWPNTATGPVQPPAPVPVAVESDVEPMPSPTLVKFGWTMLDEQIFPNLSIPYLERSAESEESGTSVRYVSVRITEKAVLSNFVDLSPECLALPPLNSILCTEAECAQLNEINKNHVDLAYGPEEFLPNRESMVHLDKFQEFFDVLKRTAQIKPTALRPIANVNLAPSQVLQRINIQQQQPQQLVQMQQQMRTLIPPMHAPVIHNQIVRSNFEPIQALPFQALAVDNQSLFLH